MRRFQVMTSRESEFENPVKVSRGEEVICIEDSDPMGDWPGWTLCRTANNEGWIPYQIIDRRGTVGHIIEDYHAIEFDLVTGEVLVMEKETNGWIWCYKADNKEIKAWAPLNCILEMD